MAWYMTSSWMGARFCSCIFGEWTSPSSSEAAWTTTLEALPNGRQRSLPLIYSRDSFLMGSNDARSGISRNICYFRHWITLILLLSQLAMNQLFCNDMKKSRYVMVECMIFAVSFSATIRPMSPFCVCVVSSSEVSSWKSQVVRATICQRLSSLVLQRVLTYSTVGEGVDWTQRSLLHDSTVRVTSFTGEMSAFVKLVSLSLLMKHSYLYSGCRFIRDAKLLSSACLDCRLSNLYLNKFCGSPSR